MSIEPATKNCEDFAIEDKRACEKCVHYVTRDSRGVVLCGCDSWECEFEPKEGEEGAE